MTTNFQPRHSYINVADTQDTLGGFVERRFEAVAKVSDKSTDWSFCILAGFCEDVALYRYGLGYPLGVVAEDLRLTVGALCEMFRKRGTGGGARRYAYEKRPAPPEVVARGGEPFVEVKVEVNQSNLGPVDYSSTNSRDGFLAVCKALIVGDEVAERELAGMIWDPPGASYLGKNSEVCSFNDQRVAYALKAYYEKDAARFEAELRGVRAPTAEIAAEATMLRALVARDKASFIHALDAMLRWHRKEATRDKWRRNDSKYYICFPALGLSGLALRAGICTPDELPADEPFLPLTLLSAGPNAKSYTNKLLAPFDPKRTDWKSRELLIPAIQGGKLVFVGADSKSKYDFGRVFFAERTVSEKDLFEKLRENGEATSDETTLAPLRLYIERLQPLGIDSIVVLRSGSVESVELEVVSATASDFPTRSTDQDGVNAPADG